MSDSSPNTSTSPVADHQNSSGGGGPNAPANGGNQGGASDGNQFVPRLPPSVLLREGGGPTVGPMLSMGNQFGVPKKDGVTRTGENHEAL